MDHYSHACPFCNYQDVIGGNVDIGPQHAYQTCTCPECGRSWQNAYELASYIEYSDISEED